MGSFSHSGQEAPLRLTSGVIWFTGPSTQPSLSEHVLFHDEVWFRQFLVLIDCAHIWGLIEKEVLPEKPLLSSHGTSFLERVWVIFSLNLIGAVSVFEPYLPLSSLLVSFYLTFWAVVLVMYECTIVKMQKQAKGTLKSLVGRQYYGPSLILLEYLHTKGSLCEHGICFTLLVLTCSIKYLLHWSFPVESHPKTYCTQTFPIILFAIALDLLSFGLTWELSLN